MREALATEGDPIPVVCTPYDIFRAANPALGICEFTALSSEEARAFDVQSEQSRLAANRGHRHAYICEIYRSLEHDQNALFEYVAVRPARAPH